MKFQVKNSPHSERGRVYNPGDSLESNEDLVKLFPNKFERLPEDAKVPPPELLPKDVVGPAQVESIREARGETREETPSQEEKPKAKGKAKKGKAEEDKAGLEEEWQDCTASFPEASKNDVVVVEKAGKYNLFYGADRSTPLNEEPLSKKEAENFIKEVASS